MLPVLKLPEFVAQYDDVINVIAMPPTQLLV